MKYKFNTEREGVVTFKESPMAIQGISVTA
jgi:hypothetical protein